jgi:hypothetical protein
MLLHHACCKSCDKVCGTHWCHGVIETVFVAFVLLVLFHGHGFFSLSIIEVSECNEIYRVIQEELPPLMELISEDILSKKCHINLGPILNFYLNFNYKITSS